MILQEPIVLHQKILIQIIIYSPVHLYHTPQFLLIAYANLLLKHRHFFLRQFLRLPEYFLIQYRQTKHNPKPINPMTAFPVLQTQFSNVWGKQSRPYPPKSRHESVQTKTTCHNHSCQLTPLSFWDKVEKKHC